MLGGNHPTFPSLKRRGGCAVKKILRSHLSPRRRGGQAGGIFRPQLFRRTDRPVSGALVAPRLFIHAASTPPFQGGEYARSNIHSHLLKPAFTVLIGTLLLSGFMVARQQPSVWIGIRLAAEKAAIRVVGLPFESPADKAGVLINDLIVGVDGRTFDAESSALEKEFREFITKHAPGDAVTLNIMRDGTPMVIRVVIEERPGQIPVKEYSFPKINWPEERLAADLIEQFNFRKAYEELRQHLAQLGNTGDRFRLSRVASIQREPFQLRTIAGQTFDQVAAAMNQRNPQVALSLAAAWLDTPLSPGPPLKKGITFERHLDQLVELLRSVRMKREEAFQKLTPEDQQFLENNCDAMFAAFSETLDLESEKNRDKRRMNTRVLELAAQVDFAKLFEGAELLWRVAQDDYLDDLESALRKAWEASGRPEGIFINRDSPVGKILVGGTGSTWYTDDAAILLDLGGNDFYTNNAGSARGSKLPAALLIDFAGNDAYEATFDWAQGAARMGHGLLIDRRGNDEYIGRAWAQGAAVLGTALLLDESGNDIYRAAQYAQGAAAWGIALHIDYEGDDTYDARLLSQAVAFPGGAGWLLDIKGNDSYYSKGERPTTYGDAGIFDSGSQGFGIGFREMQSGGVALLYDGGGKDRYEAGNFSQGGGYYFGIGMLRDAGKENDVYIGSRYAQGFGAHEAIGFFEDMGGDDSYTTRHAVAQGTAWDETITAFIDHAGDDIYEGGASFSQGASAHNGFSLFLDLGGKNRFTYAQPQGSAGPNDYHGGSSFSLFVAVEDKGNSYTSKMRPSTTRLNGDYGLFVDLPGSIESAVKKRK